MFTRYRRPSPFSLPSSSQLEGINDDDFHCLLLNPSHSLKSLNLSHSGASNLTFQALSLPTNKLVLEALNVASTPLKYNSLTRITDNLVSTLISLDIRSCHLLDRGADLLTFLTNKDNLPNLTELSLTLYFLSEEFEVDPTTNGEEEEEEQQYPASLLVDYLGMWTCPHCTLINEEADSRCAACFGKVRSFALDELAAVVSLTQSSLSQRAPTPSPPISSHLPSPVKKRPKFKFTPITAPLNKLIIDLRIDDEVQRRRKVDIEYGEDRRAPGSPARTPPRHKSYQEETPTPATPDPVAVSTAASSFFAGLCANANSSLEELTLILSEETSTDKSESAAGEDQWHQRQEPATTSFRLSLPVARSLIVNSPNLKSLKFDGIKISSREPLSEILQLQALTSIVIKCDEEVGESCDVPSLLRAISERGADLVLDNLQFIIRRSTGECEAEATITAALV